MRLRTSNVCLSGIAPVAVVVGLVFAASPRAFAQTPARAAAPARHVIVISLDGFPAYALADPTVPAPNLRSLARDGAMAAAMTPVNPTVTWPNHTTIVTGVGPDRHGVLYNGLPRRTGEGLPLKVDPYVEKTVLVQAPTVYDAAHAAGLTTAEVDWVAIERAPTITWSFAEWAGPEGRVEREMVAAGLVTEEELRTFTKAPITLRDEIWTRAAAHIIKTHKPNLLLFHLLTTDSVQHRYGARSLAGNAALALADAQVGRIVDACRVAGILPDTTFIIVSDHGFRSYTKTIRPNAVLAKAGVGDAAWVISEGGTAMVYATRSAEKGSPERAKTLDAVRQALAPVDGIARVLTPEEYASFGYPRPDANERMADLVLAARDGFAFNEAKEGDAVVDVPAGASPGSHGFLNTDADMGAIFIASGAGVKRGVALGVIRNLDVAPTIARLLGLELKDVSGQPLLQIFR